MTWINIVSFEQAQGKLKKLYQRVVGPDGNVDNILMAHSLRPHTLEGHMALYKNVLHHSSNQLDKSQLEALGVYVSLLNQCDYCVEHHYQGYKRLIQDEVKAQALRNAMQNERLEDVLSNKEMTLFGYAKKLTLAANSV
ncbi:MAG: carboxymuconolactone decarboxylase family protein, partial [Kangiellaceae bacterium]|nr:carboxymuconolactone decarboxylase family protein [Kangiellaceae bacterium]